MNTEYLDAMLLQQKVTQIILQLSYHIYCVLSDAKKHKYNSIVWTNN